MADLLECLVQVRALGETLGRLTALVEAYPDEAWHNRAAGQGSSALEHLVLLTNEETSLSERLRIMLVRATPCDVLATPPEPPGEGPFDDESAALMLASFSAQRRRNLEILAGCSAEELARTQLDPLRGSLQVADLVALSLANDTDRIGQIRERLGRPATPSPTHGDA